MPNVLVNRAKMSVSGTPGTGVITLGSAVPGFDTFANAGVANTNTVSYFIEDGTNFEWGTGTYSSTGPTLTRTSVGRSSSGAATAITLTSAAIVSLTALAGDLTYGTASEYLANTDKNLGVNGPWAAAVPVTITYAATQTLDLATFINGKIALTGNIALSTTSNVKKGQTGIIQLSQDATGSRTLSYSTTYYKAVGGSIILSTAASAVDFLSYFVCDDGKLLLALAKGPT